MFFNSWNALLRVLVVGCCAYAALIFLLRISGKRTLSKMNAFDFVITVSLGSTLATVLLSKDIALSEGVLALALLIFLQFSITGLSVHSRWFIRLVKAEPRLLYHKGEFLQSALQSERILEIEILQAMRSQGVMRIEQVEAVVLETDGTMSILKKSSEEGANVLANVSQNAESLQASGGTSP